MNKFVIAGVQRSGTTMLSVMLERHKDIFMEPKVMSFRLIAAYQNMLDLLPLNGDVNIQDFIRWIVESDKGDRLTSLIDFDLIEDDLVFQEIVNVSIDKKISDKGKKIWGDKAPNVQHYLSDLLYLIPNTKVIHIIRDGRAVASSMSNRAFRNISLSAQEWVNGCATGLVNQSILGKSQYKIVKYEDLLQNPEMVMREICTFLNLEYDENIIGLDKVDAGDKNYVKPYFDTNKITEWKSSISPSMLKKLERIQIDMLIAFGYEIENKGIQQRSLSTSKTIRLNLWDFYKSLFRAKKEGMKDKKMIVYRDSIKSRCGRFVTRSCQEIFSLKIHKALFPRRYYSSKKYKKD